MQITMILITGASNKASKLMHVEFSIEIEQVQRGFRCYSNDICQIITITSSIVLTYNV